MTTSDTPRWSALPVLLAGAFMVVLDFFVVNVALPSIATDLGAGEGALEWVVAGYGLAFASLLVMGGRLGDSHGRRRVFTIGLVLFTLTSLACGVAPDPATLVIARVAQGISAAFVMPQVLAIIGIAFKGPHYVRAVSIYGMTLGLAAVGGQLIGGALVESDLAGLAWRWCFLINIPVGVGALAFMRLVPESKAERRTPLDLGGAATLALGLVGVLLPLIEGRQHGWPAWTWVSLALAPAILAAFVTRQRRLSREGRAPLLDLELFRSRAFSTGLFAALLLACAQAAYFVYMALYLQEGRGLDPLEAGLVFAILAAAYVAASGPAPQLTTRFGGAVVAAGGLMLALGFALFALAIGEYGGGGSLLAFTPALVLSGAGIGLCMTPLTSIVLGGVDPERVGAASGALSTMQQVGYSLGVAVTGVIFFGAAGEGIPHAFQVSLFQLTAVAGGVVVASRLLPGPARKSEPAPARAGA